VPSECQLASAALAAIIVSIPSIDQASAQFPGVGFHQRSGTGAPQSFAGTNAIGHSVIGNGRDLGRGRRVDPGKSGHGDSGSGAHGDRQGGGVRPAEIVRPAGIIRIVRIGRSGRTGRIGFRLLRSAATSPVVLTQPSPEEGGPATSERSGR
jgi:hypothetical protein